jgi:ribosomal protein L37AE/L43A
MPSHMADAPKPDPPVVPLPGLRLRAEQPGSAAADAMVCERCGGANVYRMHAVWRCADCGFKTDCCGW